ncbi:hypothetical protein CDAR_27941, partial [Caerostris darwini]
FRTPTHPEIETETPENEARNSHSKSESFFRVQSSRFLTHDDRHYYCKATITKIVW